ncbi:MAG: TlpA family protein disulfide reductase [Odoribacteraceae bacterium]|jgi:peroxiredoxin|nr:TlpA family protein disulfide reductase [Odoribacteraceae bacterium]
MKQLMMCSISLLVVASCVREKAVDNYETSSLVKVGDEVPDFSLTRDGTTISKQSLAGKKTLLVLFSTTCGDCRLVLPTVEEAWKELREDPEVLVATISREETAEAVSAYWSEAGFTMPYYLDVDREVFKKFATAYTPRVYLVDARQRVVEMHVETLEISADELCRRVRAL